MSLYDNRGGGAGIFIGECASLALTNTIIASHPVGIRVTLGSTTALNGSLWYANPTDLVGGSNHINDLTGAPVFSADGFHIYPDSAEREAGVITHLIEDIDGKRLR